MRTSWLGIFIAVVLVGMTAVADAQEPAIVVAAGTPPQRAVATALDAVCPHLAGATGPAADLRNRCTELVTQASNPALRGQVELALQQ
ncbi:MAG: hypothetical protein DMD81_12100, partial [Candidatus Rokuibacteriota bacterium]